MVCGLRGRLSPAGPRAGRRERGVRVRRRRVHGETGIATLAAMLLMPAVVLVILSVAQAVVYYHASHLATAAAQEGVRAAQVLDATEADGQAQAQDFLAQSGPSLVLAPTVDVTRSADTARVEVRATAARLVPGLSLDLHAVASGPVERFVGDPG
jgi:Flp pilus assembly protein TadG